MWQLKSLKGKKEVIDRQLKRQTGWRSVLFLSKSSYEIEELKQNLKVIEEKIQKTEEIYSQMEKKYLGLDSRYRELYHWYSKPRQKWLAKTFWNDTSNQKISE